MIEEMLIGAVNAAIILFLIVLAFFAFKVFIYSVLAPRDLVFGLLNEGEIVSIVEGGKLKNAKMRQEGKYLGPGYWVKDGSVPKTMFERLFPGLIWIGIPGINKVYTYKFIWTKVLKGAEMIERMDPNVRSIFAKAFTYGMRLIDAETKSMVKLSIDFGVVLRVVNPEIALFKNDKWLDMVTSTIVAAFRDFIKTFEGPENVIKDQGVLGNMFFEYMQKKAPSTIKGCNNIIEELRNARGVEVDAIQILNVDYGEWGTIAIEVKTAEIRKEAQRVKAEGDKIAMILRGEAEKEYERLLGEGKAAGLTAYKDAQTIAFEKQFAKIGVMPALVADWHQALQASQAYIEGGAFTNAVNRFSSLNGNKPISDNELINILQNSGMKMEDIGVLIAQFLKMQGVK